ncbi:hypothetical protein LCEOLIKB_01931 [Aeromonas hydrophila]
MNNMILLLKQLDGQIVKLALNEKGQDGFSSYRATLAV